MKEEQFISTDEHGNRFYYSDKSMTVLHREDGPAIVSANGFKAWYIDGKRHREDGPAIEYTNGNKEWFIDGNCHREDGPAIEYSDGCKEWYIDGKRHREDGPAIEEVGGFKEWYIDGKRLTEEQLKNHLTLLPKNRRSRVERVLRYALCSDSRR